MIAKRRKLASARQRLLDERHKRDCPAWRNIEFLCIECAEIHEREMNEDAQRSGIDRKAKEGK